MVTFCTSSCPVRVVSFLIIMFGCRENPLHVSVVEQFPGVTNEYLSREYIPKAKDL